MSPFNLSLDRNRGHALFVSCPNRNSGHTSFTVIVRHRSYNFSLRDTDAIYPLLELTYTKVTLLSLLLTGTEATPSLVSLTGTETMPSSLGLTGTYPHCVDCQVEPL